MSAFWTSAKQCFDQNLQPEVFEKSESSKGGCWEQEGGAFPSVWDGIWEGNRLPQFEIETVGTQQQLGVPLDDNASVITSSCNFPLSGVVGLPLPEEELDGCWDDLEDIFGHADSAETQGTKGRANHQRDENIASSSSMREDEEATSTLQVQQKAQDQTTSEMVCDTGALGRSAAAEAWHFPPGQASSYSLIADNHYLDAPRLAADGSQEQTQLKAEVSGQEDGADVTVLNELGRTMLKLDTGTRLCIRNALYRLATGAASRVARSDNSNVEEQHSLSETCTNPIDRVVASLLFYRLYSRSASSSSSQASQDSVCFSSTSWLHQSKMGETLPNAMLGSSKLPLPALHKTRPQKKPGTNRI